MEQIKINGEIFLINEIIPITQNILKIIFDSKLPETYGNITTLTNGGEEAYTLNDYDTVYRDEGQTVYLSNNGSAYEAPETSDGPGEPPEPYIPTLEELKARKRREVATECERLIYAGISVMLADGSVEHYALTIEDQLNLFGKLSQITAGATQLEYHADGKPCRYYNATDMQAIITAAMWHVSYHTTYCNALNMWIAGCQTAEEVQTIFCGADVPEEYRSEVLDAYLVEIANMAGGDGNDTDPA